MTGGTGLDTYQICIQARFDTYQIPFFEIQRRPLKRAPNTALRLTHVRERKLAVPPLSIIPIFKGTAHLDPLLSAGFSA